jgi:hypothetical protein
MRTISPALTAHLAARRGLVVRLLFYAWPKNRTTNAIEEIGLWTGSTAQEFTIEGDTRTYIGAGGVMSVASIVTAIGLDIRHQRISLNNIFPEVEDLMRLYEPHTAPAVLHRALFDPDTRALLEEPHRLFKGAIEKAPSKRPEAGGVATADLSLVSSARRLTRTLTARQSDANQQQRGADRALRWADVSGEIVTPWGEA